MKRSKLYIRLAGNFIHRHRKYGHGCGVRYRQAVVKVLRAGLVEQFMEAGAIVESPCCGPCMGGSFGLPGDGEVGLATSNRNFQGRQGSAKAFVYLSSPATAAASALTGEITDPRKG